MDNVLVVLCGNCRTFIDCIESCYENVILKLFPNDKYNIHVYLYLKLSDPGPKGQYGWNFSYPDVESTKIISKLQILQEKYNSVSIEYKIIQTNEISDEELLSQVKSRDKYRSFYATDSTLLRGMHCHYNFEKCGEYILEKEKKLNSEFKYIAYIRPDLYFTSPCLSIESYSQTLVTLGIALGNHENNNDHIAIIPRNYLTAFFFDRMNVYRTNTSNIFYMPENVYWHTIPYEVKEIGNYYIKRT